jgi:hypothetical protein
MAKACRQLKSNIPPQLAKILRGQTLNAVCSLLIFTACWLSGFSMASSAANSVALNLSSTTKNLTGSSALGSATSVQIRVGTSMQTVTGTTSITPAEFLAVQQVLSAGSQSIVVGVAGAATGGSFVTNTVSQGLSSLVVPSGVTAIDNFGSSASQVFSGNLVNSGRFFAISTNPLVSTASITATNITNQQGGLLTTVLPVGGIAGFIGATDKLNLSLSAISQIINQGQISSSGNLMLSSTNGIQNSGGAGSVLQAAGTLTVVTPSLINSGVIAAGSNIVMNTNAINNTNLIQSTGGAINITNLTGNTLSIQNDNGTISAQSALTIAAAGGTGSNLSVTGGVLAGSNALFAAGSGTASINVTDLPNNVAINAGQSSLGVSAGTNGLSLAPMSGLSSLAYTGSGDVSFYQVSTGGGNVNVNTTGNINVLNSDGQSSGSVNTSGISGNAGNITLIAGQSVNSGDLIAAGAGAGNGGNITVSAGNTLTAGNINASSGATSGNAGAISLSAGSSSNGAVTVGSILDGAQGGSVTITSPGTAIINGSFFAPGAAVTLAAAGQTITGSVNVQGGTTTFSGSQNGQLDVDLSQLATFGGSTITVGSSTYTANIILNSNCNNCVGNVTSVSFDTQGKFIGTGNTVQLGANTDFSVIANAGINTGSVLGAKSISFATQGALTVDGNLNSVGALTLTGDMAGQGNALTVGAGQTLTGTSVTLSTGAGNVITGGSINATQGALVVNAGGNLNVQNNGSLNSSSGDLVLNSAGNIGVGTGSLGSSGGNVIFNAGGNINVTGAKIDASSSSGSGGGVAIVAGATQTDIGSLLASLNAARVAGQEIVSVTGGAFSKSNVVNSTGSSLLKVVFPADATKTVTDNTFNLNGGVIFVDPPAGNNVTVTGTTFTSSGTALTGGSSGGGTGTGGGTTGGVTTGAGITGGNAGGSSGTVDGGAGIGVGVSTGNVFSTSPISPTASSTFSSDLNLNGISSATTARDDVGQLDIENHSSSIIPSDVTDGVQVTGWSEAIYCAPPGVLKENDKIDKDSWIMAANKCQPFSFQCADGSIIIGTGPAIFAPASNRTLLLKEGKLLVIAGQNMIVVRTPLCNITVPVNSATTIEFTPAGVARLTSLAGGKASVSLTRQGETMILSAAPGEQLVLTEAGVPAQEIACVPAVTHKKIDTWMIQLGNVHGQKFSYDRTEMVAQEGLLNCTLGCFSKIQQAMLDQIRKSMLLEQPRELHSMLPLKSGKPVLLSKSMPSSPNHFRAVGFGHSMDMTVPDVTTISANSASFKYTSDPSLSLDKPNVVSLKNGDILVSTTAATTVHAGDYTLDIAGGTIAMVSNRDNHLIVRNLFENKTGSITVATPDLKSLRARVGQELIVGHTGMSFTRALNEDTVGRRKMHPFDDGRSTTGVSCEVSLVSLLQNTDLMAQLNRSQAPEDRAIMNKIEKMAVALQIITSAHGNYSIVGE